MSSVNVVSLVQDLRRILSATGLAQFNNERVLNHDILRKWDDWDLIITIFTTLLDLHSSLIIDSEESPPWHTLLEERNLDKKLEVSMDQEEKNAREIVFRNVLTEVILEYCAEHAIGHHTVRLSSSNHESILHKRKDCLRILAFLVKMLKRTGIGRERLTNPERIKPKKKSNDISSPYDNLSRDELISTLKKRDADANKTPIKTHMREERLDERRYIMLRAQIMQQERELSVLNEAISLKNGVLGDVRSLLVNLLSQLGKENKSKHVGSSIKIIDDTISKFDILLQQKHTSFDHNEHANKLVHAIPLSIQSNLSILLLHLEKSHRIMIRERSFPDTVLTQGMKKQSESDDIMRDNAINQFVDCLRETIVQLEPLCSFADGKTSDFERDAKTRQMQVINTAMGVLNCYSLNGVTQEEYEDALAHIQSELHAWWKRQTLWEAELRYYRKTHHKITEMVAKMLGRAEKRIALLDRQGSGIYAQVADELDECLCNWANNSSRLNLQRLVGLLQTMFPKIQWPSEKKSNENYSSLEIRFRQDMQNILIEYQREIQNFDEDELLANHEEANISTIDDKKQTLQQPEWIN